MLASYPSTSTGSIRENHAKDITFAKCGALYAYPFVVACGITSLEAAFVQALAMTLSLKMEDTWGQSEEVGRGHETCDIVCIGEFVRKMSIYMCTIGVQNFKIVFMKALVE